jgi:hypothetical protein
MPKFLRSPLLLARARSNDIVAMKYGWSAFRSHLGFNSAKPTDQQLLSFATRVATAKQEQQRWKKSKRRSALRNGINNSIRVFARLSINDPPAVFVLGLLMLSINDPAVVFVLGLLSLGVRIAHKRHC